MPSKLESQLIKWLLLKPADFMGSFTRTKYGFDGRTLTVKQWLRKAIVLQIAELDEIGIETTDQGPFVEDVFWILTNGEKHVRIPDMHPIFETLRGRFESLEGFDWSPFIEAMGCNDNRYFSCWKRRRAVL